MNINLAVIGGRLTRGPKSTTSPKGKAITELSFAINRSYTGEDERVWEETTSVDVVSWGKLAEAAAKFCRKDSTVLVRGRLQFDHREEKQTQEKRSKLRVVAETIDFVDRRPADTATETQSAVPAQPKQKKRRTCDEKTAAFVSA